MNDRIYNSICEIFNFDKITKKISFGNKLSLEPFQESMIYKTFLFEFCFLIERGTVDFKDLNDIWFFKTFNAEEKEIALEVIYILINKIEKKNIENEIYLKVVVNLLNLNKIEKYKIFKYLQSIYSQYNDMLEYSLFPLIYTLGFNNEFIKSVLKNDLMDIMSPLIEKIYGIDNINYYNINEEFLSVFNQLLYYIKFNQKSQKEKKDISPLYKYLCNKENNAMKAKYLNEAYPESINYFLEIKNLLIEYNNKFEKENEKLIKSQFDSHKEDFIEEKFNQSNNNKGKNENSTKSSLDKDQSENIAKNNLSNGEQELINISPKNNSDNISDGIKSLIKSEMKSYFSYFSKLNKLNNICSKITTLLKEMQLNKNSLEKYYEILFEIKENKILINKLSSNILLFQNPNILKTKRKLTEAIIITIMEKFQEIFSFSSDYFPSNINLKNLMNYISEKLKTCTEEETDFIKEDLERLDKIIKNPDNKMNLNSEINIDNKTKKGMKIKIVFDFLRFCKNHLHQYIHSGTKVISYYLLPISLFSSNLKYADYIFSLTKSNNNDKMGEKNEISFGNENIDLKLYKYEKIIEIGEALQLIFQSKINYLNEIDIDKLITSKKECQNKLKLFNQKIRPLLQIFPAELYQNYIISDEIKYKEADLITKLNNFDIYISNIIDDKLSRKEALKIIQDIKETIIFETKEAEKLSSDFEELIEPNPELLNSKTNRIYLILNFLKIQNEKINNARLNIFEKYDNYLDILKDEAIQYKNYFQKNLLINVNLFEEWTKDAKFRFKEQYLKLDVLLDNFRELLTFVRLDINYSHDGKFFLWMIKNKFSFYLR